QAVAEQITLLGAEAPVRSVAAGLGRGPQSHGEGVLLTGLDGGGARGRLEGELHLLGLGGVVLGEAAHVVSADEPDKAVGGPGNMAGVAEDPSLLENKVGLEDG